VERGMGGNSADLTQRLGQFRRDKGGRAEDMRRLAQGWISSIDKSTQSKKAHTPAHLLALAWPDRIAMARGGTGQFLLANGRAANVDAADALARESFMVVAELTGSAAAARITLAAPLPETEFTVIAGNRLSSGEELSFDSTALALRARRVKRLDAIVLASDTMPVPVTEEAARVMAEGIAAAGIHRLPWSKASIQWRDRVMFLRRAAEGAADNPWPDLSDETLAGTVTDWLAPFLTGLSSISQLGADKLREALETLLPWTMKRQLEQDAPTHFLAPTGSEVAVDYEAEGGPVLAIRVQELYGLKNHPGLAGGRVPLTLHLLSPAHRPIQITKDLPGFWRGSWAAVKTEMKGRYPRHLWPDDPAAALPTTRAKPRGT
jgi:ATP-dependent helicase HrpB